LHLHGRPAPRAAIDARDADSPSTYLYLLSPFLAFLLLAAHFYRAANFAAALVALLALALLFVRRSWAARVAQVLLLLGTIEWVRATIALVLARSGMGQPYLRLAFIMGAVSLFTALCALVFRAARLRAHFGSGPSP
jgi:prepilin signal peptidase PulO-like enzyme (type II secretory pathway)